MSGATVLSYHDTCLKESDLFLLKGPQWLNDKIIAFYFEYLEYDIFKEFADRLCFITPDVTQFIKLYEGDDLSLFPNLLLIPEKDLVFLAVNDNSDAASVGGTHWSLLVYLRKDHTFYHYDSSASSNSMSARMLFRKLKPAFAGHPLPKFIEVDTCPQQSNGYDCGVYMLSFTKAICDIHLRGERVEDTLMAVNADKTLQWRSDVHDCILSLSNSVHSE